MRSGYQLADPENKQTMTMGGIVALGPVANKIGALTARRDALRSDPTPACNGGGALRGLTATPLWFLTSITLVLFIYFSNVDHRLIKYIISTNKVSDENRSGQEVVGE